MSTTKYAVITTFLLGNIQVGVATTDGYAVCLDGSTLTGFEFDYAAGAAWYDSRFGGEPDEFTRFSAAMEVRLVDESTLEAMARQLGRSAMATVRWLFAGCPDGEFEDSDWVD